MWGLASSPGKFDVLSPCDQRMNDPTQRLAVQGPRRRLTLRCIFRCPVTCTIRHLSVRIYSDLNLREGDGRMYPDPFDVVRAR